MKHLICKILGHKFKIVKAFSLSVQKLECKRCKKQFGINHDVKALIEWDWAFELEHMLIFPEAYLSNSDKNDERSVALGDASSNQS